MRTTAILGLLVAIVAGLSNCAATGQKYKEVTYGEPDAEGFSPVTSEVTVRNRTVAPPFGAKAVSDHSFDTTVSDGGGYEIHMGSTGDLEGGDLSAALQALADVMAELSKVIAELKSPVPLTMVEPLTD